MQTYSHLMVRDTVDHRIDHGLSGAGTRVGRLVRQVCWSYFFHEFFARLYRLSRLFVELLVFSYTLLHRVQRMACLQLASVDDKALSME
jgi:hypothetical protein